ncbi:hypothetical protein [Acinetobacter nectaris]|uniref:hypothetical protein n=1 Tax=Acinetobacter nectaris TaxID=1219382 RepID=UPI001F467F20|nr:hypothetical protein [Acinetobacter nectaris]MCF8999270.1 hypothetical protein [Acinetobacter nectaris]MCF9028123.1 hypothetical protein [Acinetobacter nectaris]
MKKPTRNQGCHKYKRGFCMTKFKVGDYLVAKRHFESNEIFKVDHIGRTGGIYDDKWRLLYDEKFEHATPEEIKAGIRLP